MLFRRMSLASRTSAEDKPKFKLESPRGNSLPPTGSFKFDLVPRSGSFPSELSRDSVKAERPRAAEVHRGTLPSPIQVKQRSGVGLLFERESWELWV